MHDGALEGRWAIWVCLGVAPWSERFLEGVCYRGKLYHSIATL